MNFRIALLQILPEATTAGNLKKGIEACRRAKSMGADLALFCEMWNTGYDVPAEPNLLRAAAVEADGEFVSAFGRLAAELDMAIAITFLEAHEPRPRNSVRVFNRFGKPVLTYSKLHLCSWSEDEAVLSAGDDFYVAELDTACGPVKIGAMICFDREFPESGRILMLKGAEVVLVPNACPMEQNRIAQLRSRAYENMFAIATANYPWGKFDCNGHSTVFDGIMCQKWGENDFRSRDMMVLETDESEGVFVADIPLDKLREYRESEVWGNAYRRPSKYRLLVSDEVQPPFIRENRLP